VRFTEFLYIICACLFGASAPMCDPGGRRMNWKTKSTEKSAWCTVKWSSLSSCSSRHNWHLTCRCTASRQQSQLLSATQFYSALSAYRVCPERSLILPPITVHVVQWTRTRISSPHVRVHVVTETTIHAMSVSRSSLRPRLADDRRTN